MSWKQNLKQMADSPSTKRDPRSLPTKSLGTGLARKAADAMVSRKKALEEAAK